MPGTVPNEEELKTALQALRTQHPVLGIAKLHALLLSDNPTWSVSEKRAKKFLQNEGLSLKPTNGQKSTADTPYPVSKVIEGLDVSKWTSKVQVKYFDSYKGKGLVTTEKIAEGEVLWKEDPFILAPEWEIYDLQLSSVACAYCSTPLSKPALSMSCPGSARGTGPSCSARFCNRLCLSRSGRTHPLLCPAQNPSSVALLAFARRHEWMALHALAQCTARVLLAEQQDDATFKSDWEVVRALAQLGMEERAKGGWMGSAEPDRETWKKTYELFIQAFKDPATEPERKRLAKLLKKPIRQEVTEELFEYDAFLRGLGRMSLNLEAHGGLYVLHSHMNHSCIPNISVRHFDQRTALARITVIARRDIEPGEELFISYVNPQMPLENRRKQLLEWGFGACKCSRCTTEESDPEREVPATVASDDLEQELKASLGVL